MPKLWQQVPNVKKRKTTFSACESNSGEEDGGSSSASAPNILNLKRPKKQLSIASEEVGENDELPLLGSEFFEHRSSSSVQGFLDTKPWLLERNACSHDKDLEMTEKAKIEVHANLASSAGKYPSECLGISMSSTRHCMQSVMNELREARDKLLQWMRREMNDFLQGIHCSSSGHAAQSKQSTRVEAGERAAKARMMADCSPNPDSIGVHCGQHGQDSGGLAIADQIDAIDKIVAQGGHCDSSEGGDDARLQLVGAAHYREEFGFTKPHTGFHKGLGVLRVESKKVPVGMVSGVNSEVGFEEESKDSEGLRDVTFIGNLHNRSNLGVGVPAQSSQRGATEFGQLACSRELFGYDSQRFPWSFKDSALESAKGVKMRAGMNSRALCTSTTSSNDAGKLIENPFSMSPQEGKPRLLDMHSAAVDLQNPTHMNLMWNLVSQSGRAVNHSVHDTTISPFNNGSRSKVGNGGIEPFCDMGGNQSSVYDNSLGLINSAFIPSANAAERGQLLPPMRHTPQSNSFMSTLLGVPGQMDVRNSATSLSFLGLSVNGLSGPACNRQMFSGMYFDDNAQNNLVTANKMPPAALQDSHRRGPLTQERGVLELNSLFL